jgi:arabinofuranan 3-O-arabinosyltransferase
MNPGRRVLVEDLGVDRQTVCPRKSARRPDIFQAWWLTSFGITLAALYLLYFAILYRAGTWIVDKNGLPIYTDFGNGWAAGILALHGNAAAIYDSIELTKAQASLFGRMAFSYPFWPYPPTFFLLLAPLGLLPYRAAFVLWDVASLVCCVAVVYLIVRRKTAIALALALPFTAWNFMAAQNGFLTGALIGGSLLYLERRPVLSGLFLGCLTYKPQFGILFPIALVASRQWRAIASAAATALLLVVLSAVVFGVRTWAAFPHGLLAQSGLNLLAAATSNWGYLQSPYGLARLLQAATAVAWFAQGATTAVLAVIVWQVWRSDVAYSLKAAILAAAALLATPYAFAYDMAGLVVPAGFLAADQLERGLLPGDKAIWIGLFGVPLALLVTLGDNLHGPTFGGVPAGLATTLALLATTLRRAAAMPTSGVPGRRFFWLAEERRQRRLGQELLQ